MLVRLKRIKIKNNNVTVNTNVLEISIQVGNKKHFKNYNYIRIVKKKQTHLLSGSFVKENALLIRKEDFWNSINHCVQVW